ncbi:MAG: molybdopterin-dependent oxidoreductase [Bradymonadia bacterium]
MSDTISCKVNGVDVEVPKGTSVYETAKAAGFVIPHFCYHPGLSRPANCRMCLVDASNSRKPIPSCYIDAAPDAEYTTDSEHVHEMRRAILEFILLNHPVDCPICDQAGECELQDNYFDHSLQTSRLVTPKVHKPKATPLSDKIMFDGERCIVCTRCVRFCDEVAKTSEIGVINRGEKSEIAIFPGQDLSNPYQMNIVDLCPVGALTSRDFRFKIRVWFMESVESVCDHCARGCSVHLDHHKGEVMRYRPRENRNVNDWWVCDEGRLSYQKIHERRVLAPVVSQNGKPRRASWTDAVDAIETAMAGVASDAVAIAVSATVSVETAYALRRLREEVLPQAQVFRTGRADGTDQDDILIRNDKNPNARGLEAVFGPLPDEVALAGAVSSRKITHVIAFGDTVHATTLAGAQCVIVAGVHASDAVKAAKVALPLQSHAEHDGVFVNFDGHVQRFHGAISPVGEAEAGYAIVSRIAGALGATLKWRTAGAVFKALASETMAFSGMTHFNLGSTGRPLVTEAPQSEAVSEEASEDAQASDAAEQPAEEAPVETTEA